MPPRYPKYWKKEKLFDFSQMCASATSKFTNKLQKQLIYSFCLNAPTEIMRSIQSQYLITKENETMIVLKNFRQENEQ